MEGELASDLMMKTALYLNKITPENVTNVDLITNNLFFLGQQDRMHKDNDLNAISKLPFITPIRFGRH